MTDFRETPGTPEDVAARAADSMAFLSDVERKAREACNYEVSDAYQNAWLVIRDQRAAIERLERQMLEWRICAQEITPGGSEFMAPEAVRGYQRDLKNRYHAAKCEAALLRKELAALSPASAKTAEDRA